MYQPISKWNDLGIIHTSISNMNLIQQRLPTRILPASCVRKLIKTQRISIWAYF